MINDTPVCTLWFHFTINCYDREYLSLYNCLKKVVNSNNSKIGGLFFPKISAKICQLLMQIIAQYYRQAYLITSTNLLFKFDLINTIRSMA